MTNERRTPPNHCPLTHGDQSPLAPRVHRLEWRCDNFEQQLGVIHEDHQKLRHQVTRLADAVDTTNHELGKMNDRVERIGGGFENISRALYAVKWAAIGSAVAIVAAQIGAIELLVGVVT